MSEEPKTQKNDFKGHYTSGGGTQLNGVVVEGVVVKGDFHFNHADQATSKDESSEAFNRALQSLAYDKMDFRRHDTTDRAYKNTCRWITRHPSYTSWLKGPSGIFWVKGKPGSGKSTLMGYLLRDFKTQPYYQNSINLSFFLHGRGEGLQKSRLGMFRSLLHQLLWAKKEAGAAFQHYYEEKCDSQGGPGKHLDWHVNEIIDHFVSALEDVAQKHSINIFIDALDEADDGTADGVTGRNIVDDFLEINDRLDRDGFRFKICFSCRHYPVVAKNTVWEVWLEDENDEDISTYVHDKLQGDISEVDSKDKHMDEWKDTIVKRAQGVFQWAAIVTDMVVRYYDDGRPPREIRLMLAEVPQGLGEIYQHILENVIDRKQIQQTLRLMRWVYLAERPLIMAELRYAMYVPDKETFDSEISFDPLPTIEEMKKRVVSLSGGLVELQGYRESEERTIQFIHQSVKDYLMRSGLKALDSMAGGDPIGLAHHQLSVICANVVAFTCGCVKNLNEYAICTQYAFAKYFAERWFSHAKKAEAQSVPQLYLLKLIEKYPCIVDQWVRLCETFEVRWYSTVRKIELSATMLHVASAYNLSNVVIGLLKTGHDVECVDKDDNSALHYASRSGHVQIVKILLDENAAVGAKNVAWWTPLEKAAENGHRDAVKLLLDHNADINAQCGHFGSALQVAVYKGHKDIVQLLLENKADVNAQCGDHGSALQAAAFYGHKDTVQLLLDYKADVNIQGGYYSSALQVAAYRGDKYIVQLLLENKADVNTQCRDHGSALQAAASRGHKDTIQLLLDYKADVNAQCGDHGSALQAAAYNGHKDIVQLLLDHKADVNARGGSYGSALQAAAYHGHKDIVQLLLDHKADVNARGGNYSSALQAAASQGHKDTVQLLLDYKADVNARGGSYGSALQAAAYHGHKDIVQLLLDHKADINARGGNYGSALQVAAYRGDKHIIQLLLDHKADVNTRGGSHSSALQVAASQGHKDIVQLLLDYKADVNARGGSHGSALQAAALSNSESVVRLLLGAETQLDLLHSNFAFADKDEMQDISTKAKFLLDRARQIREFHENVESQRENEVRATLDRGMKTDVPGSDYGYAVHAAASKGYLNIVSLLIRRSSTDVNLKDQKGRTPLWLAANYGRLDVVRYLLKRGADDVNLKDQKGRTLLWRAAKRDRLDVVRYLLKHGADQSILSNDNISPLMIATEKGNDRVVKLLKNYEKKKTIIDVFRRWISR